MASRLSAPLAQPLNFGTVTVPVSMPWIVEISYEGGSPMSSRLKGVTVWQWGPTFSGTPFMSTLETRRDTNPKNRATFAGLFGHGLGAGTHDINAAFSDPISDT